MPTAPYCKVRNARAVSLPARRRERGFTLTGLLLSVTLLVLIAAVLIPRFTHSTLATHEGLALQSLREVHWAEASYASHHPDKGFSVDLTALSQESGPTQGRTLDPNLVAGKKAGYIFTYTPGKEVNGTIRSYTITAVPEQVGTTGQRRFYSDESGEIHYNAAGAADASSPVIE